MMSTRPMRNAAKNALEKIRKIYQEYYDDDDDEYDISAYDDAEYTPSKYIAKQILTNIADYKATPEYDAFIQSTIIKSSCIEQTRKYLNIAVDKVDRHINIPEFMKFLILNPHLMITHSKFNNAIHDKMHEFINTMKDHKKINNIIASDQYSKEFIGLATIVNTNTKIHSIINLSPQFYTNIDKIAKEYEKAINSFITNLDL
jgi:protein involved in ribonucleotide reduction